MGSDSSKQTWPAVAVVVLIAAGVGVWLAGRTGGPVVVVYCAHDAIFSEAVLRDFEAETGIRVEAVFDSEATKSLSLTQRLLAERDKPVCDVFWNNEQLGTMDLADAGVLETYKGTGYRRIPDAFKDPQGRWVGFAARMRVWIVNTKAMADPTAAAEAAKGDDLSRAALAKPLYGTTRTHYTALWNALGAEGLKSWHADWQKRGGLIVAGNAMVKNLVAAGKCDFGLTDTDDFFVGKDDGKPVDLAPFRLPDQSTVVIPNTAAIIKGCRNPEAARLLVDYLASAHNELALAGSRSRQIPLGPVDEAKVPEEVRAMRPWAAAGFPLHRLAPTAGPCLAWLKEEYLN